MPPLRSSTMNAHMRNKPHVAPFARNAELGMLLETMLVWAHVAILTEKGLSPPQAAGVPTQAVRRCADLARRLNPLLARLFCGILAVWNRQTSSNATSS